MMIKNDGVTLIELLIVISIIGLLAVALGFSFEGWMGNYRIESQTKEIYSDLLEARTRAMTRNRVHFVVLNTTQYTVYDDNNPAPDGNGTLETASDTQAMQKTLANNYQLLCASALPQTVTIDTRGLMSPERDFRIDNTKNPDYDCIRITQARIQMGKYDGTNCVEK